MSKLKLPPLPTEGGSYIQQGSKLIPETTPPAAKQDKQPKPKAAKSGNEKGDS